jgi:hypothetical protein
MATGTELRFDRGARYGAAIVATLFGTYLLIATSFGAIVKAENYVGTIRSDIPLLNIVQFLIIVVTLVTALILLPTSEAHRLGGVTLQIVVLMLFATLGLEQASGNLPDRSGFWQFVLDQGFVTLFVSVGGWVIARGRHPLTWLVVVVAVVPPIVGPILTDYGWNSGSYALVMQGIVIVGGLGAVWLAAWGDRLLRSRASSRTVPAAMGAAGSEA